MRPEDRAAQRSLLVARATLERAQLLQQLDVLSPPDKPLGVASGLGRLAQGSLRGGSWMDLAHSALEMVRRHPVLVPTLATGLKLARGRAGRLALLAVVVGAVAWSLQRRSHGEHESGYEDDPPVY